MRLLWQDHAKVEFKEALTYYQSHAGVCVAQSFRDEVQRVTRQLLAFPESGVRVRTTIRQLPLHDFPFNVVYRLAPDALIVIAPAHQRRRPGYWAGRR